MMIIYTTTIRIAAYIPKEDIGIIGLNAFAKNAAPVVLEVVRVALAALLKANANLFLSSLQISLLVALCRHPSMNTKISSAAIPSTMKIAKEWIVV